jgi:hypothetical protein
MVEKKQVHILYISTDRQLVNILTKALSWTKFESCLKLLNPPQIPNKVKFEI